MKKPLFSLFLCLCTMLSLLSQNTTSDLQNTDRDFLYIYTVLQTKEEVNALSRDFSVDAYTMDPHSGQYAVRVFLDRSEYSRFLALNLPYEIIPAIEMRPGMVATSLSEMANWDKYPSYGVYVEMMQNFQTNFPDLCKIDTILAATPCPNRPHMLLAAHISTTLGQPADKPAFLYSATMHGDEVVGYQMMLHLIDYILNNPTDPQVQAVLQNVDLYICPLENPDGTYKSSNTQISSRSSSRYNWNNVDMNRNYPFLPGINGSANVQPETQAIINWVADKHFVMSANFHGGAELTNLPWDSWESRTRTHADDAWFRYICQNYVDTCHVYDNTYMTAANQTCGAVTEGGDWYVVIGSRQDYMNYYEHCREVTMEVHEEKVVTNTSDLVTYFPNSKSSLLNFIMECTYGFRGIVTDAVTGEPIDGAKIFVRNHDTFNSEVYSHLPLGTYYRPIKAGTYTVEVSAECYETQTFTISTTDGAGIRHNVQLQPLVTTPQVTDKYIRSGETATLTVSSIHTVNWYISATDSIPVATGNTFTTPTLTESTTYYVEEQAVTEDVICVSERGSVTVFVSDTVYGELSLEECPPFSYEGELLLTDGDHIFYYPGAGVGGADSALVIHLTLHPTYEDTLDIQLAVGEHFQMGDYDFYSEEEGFFQFDKELKTVFDCDSLIHYRITVSNGASGVADATLSSVILYPNPTAYECHLTGLSEGSTTEIRIFNTMGQMVRELSTDKGTVTLDLHGMKEGVYSIQLVRNRESHILKLIKL